MQTTGTATRPCPQDNSLLAALSAAEFRKLRPELELVSLPCGGFIAESGKSVTYGYFPTTAIVSITTALSGHAPEEVGVVGYEGMSGVSLLLDAGHAQGPTRSKIVQSAGYAYRIGAEVLETAFLESGEIRQLLLRYTQTLITQIAQIAACNRHHRVAEQLCRWLLLRLDRSSSNELQVTQHQIADLLGVRRERITLAAHDLELAGIIGCRRGFLTVLDRRQLERRTCECYAAIRKEYADLFPRVRRRDPLRHTLPQQARYERLQA